MNNRENIEKQVDETLNSLNGIQRAQANPFLFTRIKERFSKREKGLWGLAGNIISRPVFVIVAVLLIVFINLAIFFQNQPEATPATTQEEEQLFAGEYNLGSTALYDENMDQQ